VAASSERESQARKRLLLVAELLRGCRRVFGIWFICVPVKFLLRFQVNVTVFCVFLGFWGFSLLSVDRFFIDFYGFLMGYYHMGVTISPV
jgi:hypothetical protein